MNYYGGGPLKVRLLVSFMATTVGRGLAVDGGVFGSCEVQLLQAAIQDPIIDHFSIFHQVSVDRLVWMRNGKNQNQAVNAKRTRKVKRTKGVERWRCR